MNQLISEVNKLLCENGFEYAICGGYAIDLFLGKETRKHGDIDILAYWSDRDLIIKYMQSIGWEVYEMCGGGKAHHITNIDEQLRIKRNIFCINNECNLIKLESTDEKDMYLIEFYHVGQTRLNFVEFLFNDKSNKDFLYARNHSIRRGLDCAILHSNEIAYLAPEIVLLYKSTDTEREGYQSDFNFVIKKMNEDQKQWLRNALMNIYQSGHKWVDCI